MIMTSSRASRCDGRLAQSLTGSKTCQAQTPTAGHERSNAAWKHRPMEAAILALAGLALASATDAEQQCDDDEAAAASAVDSSSYLGSLQGQFHTWADLAWEHVAKEGLDGQITVVLMAGICLWLLGLMGRRPRVSGGLLLTWLGWAAYSVQTGRLTWSDMEMRGLNVYDRTHLFWQALFGLVRAWVEFLAPFVADLAGVAWSVWSAVPLWYKVQAVGLVLFAYLLVRMYRAAMQRVAAGMKHVTAGKAQAEAAIKHKKKVAADMLKHVAALPAGYALFFATGFIPPEHLPSVVWLLLSVAPAALSVRCFRRYAAAEDALDAALQAAGGGGDDEDDDSDDDSDDDMPLGSPGLRMSKRQRVAEYHPKVIAARREKNVHVKEAKAWLSYWTCWPLLDLLNTSIVLRFTDSVAEMPRVAIVLLVWLQVWQGSIHLRKLLRVAFRFVQNRLLAMLPGGALPNWVSAPFSTARPEISVTSITGMAKGSVGMFGRVMSFLSWALKNKGFAGFIGCILLLFTYKALFVVGSLLTAAIVWGTAVDTARIVSASKWEAMYKGRLSFWVLGRALEVLWMVPVAGTLLQLWHPVILALLLVGGETALRWICRRFDPRPDPVQEELKACWKQIAGTVGAQVTHRQLRQVYAEMGEKLTDDEINAAVQEVDANGNGLVNFEEFAAYYTRYVLP